MADIVVIRNEIKTWEREFKAEFGRNPSVDEIKARPEMADKYKLYKKLSKSVAASASVNGIPANSPITPPPRSHATRDNRASLILSKSCTVESTAPIPGFNPFSPTKRSLGRQRTTPKDVQAGSTGHAPSPNPFATPAKGKSKTRVDLDPSDPFPLIQRSQASVSNLAPGQPAPSTAVLRARKRLRGEPVSPSPNKEKRRRIGSQTALQFTRSNVVSSDSDEGGGTPEGAGSPFIDDSPVKVPVGGRSFKLLFEEAVHSATTESELKIKAKVARGSAAQTALSEGAGSVIGKDEPDWILGMNTPGTTNDRSRQLLQRGRPTYALAVQSDKNNLLPEKERFLRTTFNDNFYSPMDIRQSNKRSISDDENLDNARVSPTRPPLLPPSPPPVDANHNFSSNKNYKGKEKTKFSRKKAKIADGNDDSSDAESSTKVVDWNQRQRRQYVVSNSDDPDPILAHPESSVQLNSTNDIIQQSKVEVNLPENLRCLLSISPSESFRFEGEQVVQALLYGKRAVNYDGQKGGEIWDVGEEVEARGADGVEADDEWEGEGVPWEVGEL